MQSIFQPFRRQGRRKSFDKGGRVLLSVRQRTKVLWTKIPTASKFLLVLIGDLVLVVNLLYLAICRGLAICLFRAAGASPASAHAIRALAVALHLLLVVADQTLPQRIRFLFVGLECGQILHLRASFLILEEGAFEKDGRLVCRPLGHRVVSLSE